ncbi:MAG TPA: DNA methyltransferase [Paludibacter sp.]
MSSNTIQFPDLDSPTLDSRSEINKVVCLGKEFTSEEDRREYFRNELRTKLPELKKIEGFPIGEDEDIVALSDPPFYTACPNPWLNDFIAEWEMEKESILERKTDFQVDEPYAADVNEGKNNPIYLAHSYHTKVPHPAIMRYILHYTQPGDIVFDGFAGTGMAGVAAQMCENPEYQIKQTIEKEFKENGNSVFWGHRPIITNDLSAIASFIDYNLNNEFEYSEFGKAAYKILGNAKREFGWIYETKHEGNVKGEIIYNVWSDVINCLNCGKDFSYWKTAVDLAKNEVKKDYQCPHCKVFQNNNSSSPSLKTFYDETYNETRQIPKAELVLVSYKVGKKRFQRPPNEFDLKRVDKIENLTTSTNIPKNLMFFKGESWGDTYRAGYHIGIKYWSDFFTKSNLIILSHIYNQIQSSSYNERLRKALLFWFTASQSRLHKMNRYSPQHSRHVGPMANTYYISPTPAEISPFYFMEDKIKALRYNFKGTLKAVNAIGSASNLNINSDSVDYIFTDPPFGANIMYSELNFLWESWLGVYTNNKEEAIESRAQSKSNLIYQSIMTHCFQEFYRILKPGKWMTVEFSNTSAAIWTGLQTALQRAGFIVASVAALNKGRGGMQAIIGVVAVNQDLVISCYKPSQEFEIKFNTKQSEVTVWNFVSEHLHHLPSHIKKENNTTAIIERSPKILFDRLITFYFMRGVPIPIDAKDFQDGLRQRFIERDGMFFSSEQAAEYDEKKATTTQFIQMSWIVTNESDAIEWLKDRLRKEPQKYQDIMPEFRIATQSLRKGDTLPELQDILNESFIKELDGVWRTPDPNETKDRESLRTKVLLKEFSGYVTVISQPKAKKLKEVRVEALRAGFKNCWDQKDFKTIVFLGDMIPQNILLEDEQLLMYYDIAKDRI